MRSIFFIAVLTTDTNGTPSSFRGTALGKQGSAGIRANLILEGLFGKSAKDSFGGSAVTHESAPGETHTNPGLQWWVRIGDAIKDAINVSNNSKKKTSRSPEVDPADDITYDKIYTQVIEREFLGSGKQVLLYKQ